MSEKISFDEAQQLFWKDLNSTDASSVMRELKQVLEKNPPPPPPPPPPSPITTSCGGVAVNTSTDGSNNSKLEVPSDVEYIIQQMQTIIHKNSASFTKNNPNATRSAAPSNNSDLEKEEVTFVDNKPATTEQHQQEQPRNKFTMTKLSNSDIFCDEGDLLGEDLDVFVVQPAARSGERI